MALSGAATLGERDGRAVIRFERLLPHPVELVWCSLTERERLDAWHPTPFEVEPRVGGAVRYVSAPQPAAMQPGRVLEWSPPHLLVHTWGEDELRWELAHDPEGCRLTLEHLFDDLLKAARDGAGWHLCLRALGGCLQDRSRPLRGHGQHLPAGWNELNAAYQLSFGIDPAQATPPPAS
jgi:uncharacterized protein YndB with AHSA1/START domain